MMRRPCSEKNVRCLKPLGALLLLPLLSLLLLWGCRSPDPTAAPAVEARAGVSREASPWILYREGPLYADADRPPPAYDLVYVYPTLTADRHRALMDFSDPAVRRKARDFSEAQTRIFRSAGRVFVPAVRQLEFSRCIRELKQPLPPERSGMRFGIEDTRAALRQYLRVRNGRPFILFGHSQGAIDLYHALREMPELSPENGLVAAYLPGLPRLRAETIRRDFAGRNLRPGAAADDVGVILVWNTQERGADNPLFTVPGGYVINPINWRTDAVPAPAKDNLRSEFYDWVTGRRSVSIGFCGAEADPNAGALIVALPRSAADTGTEQLFGSEVHHVSDPWLFAGCLDANAQVRVRAWYRRQAAGVSGAAHRGTDGDEH